MIQFQKRFALKVSFISFALLFFTCIVYAQSLQNKQKMTNSNLKYGEVVKLNIKEKETFEDSLQIELIAFSHKRPRTGGPTKATAYLNVTKNNVPEQILLSVHGIDDKPEIERLDSLTWKEYEFQLKSFNYDRNIEVIVTKRK